MGNIEYLDFLKQKEIIDMQSGFKISINKLNKKLFDFQKEIVKWAIQRGRSAIFAGCGLGKSPMQLSWANQVSKHEDSPILILAPLAVSQQTKGEGNKFHIKVNICKDQNDVKSGINITNYEKLHKFNPDKFCGVVLDESSILKNFAGSTRNEIIEAFQNTPYKLCCSATPAPNDYMELGNHAEFLNIMTRSEMLAMFFINDTANTGNWRLKGHVKNNLFWKWLSSWSIMVDKPSDLGFEDGGFELPEVEYHEHIIKTKEKPKRGFLIKEAGDLNERRKVRKETIELRSRFAANLINKTDDNWIAWCNLNTESDCLTKLIDDAVEVAGKHKNDIKAQRMLDFAKGDIERIVTKPKIAGLGMNWQICNNAVFVGLNDSWEAFYQAVRRIWRFGQTKKCNIHIVIEEREGSVLKNIKRKDKQAQDMIDNMIKYTKEFTKQELKSAQKEKTDYNPAIEMEIPTWL